ncbi:putative membrane-anchored protein [Chitinophagaceae bacterium OAS944]|nr:putative membrane-anchored protein [Chitinophagaceae bacterium OAS944]
MLPIISRRHKIRFYCTIIFLPLFFLTISALMIFAKKTGRSGNSGIVFGVIITGIVIYLTYRYFKNVPVIKINDRQISFNKSVFFLRC